MYLCITEGPRSTQFMGGKNTTVYLKIHVFHIINITYFEPRSSRLIQGCVYLKDLGGKFKIATRYIMLSYPVLIGSSIWLSVAANMNFKYRFHYRLLPDWKIQVNCFRHSSEIRCLRST